MVKKPNVISSAGFLRGREATIDVTEGHEQTIAGCFTRIRLADIVRYSSADKNSVEIAFRHGSLDESILLFATIEEVDAIMDREALKVIGG
jgi:hypothetical protein